MLRVLVSLSATSVPAPVAFGWIGQRHGTCVDEEYTDSAPLALRFLELEKVKRGDCGGWARRRKQSAL